MRRGERLPAGRRDPAHDPGRLRRLRADVRLAEHHRGPRPARPHLRTALRPAPAPAARPADGVRPPVRQGVGPSPGGRPGRAPGAVPHAGGDRGFLAAGLVLAVLLGALLGLVGHDADAGLGAAGIATLGMFFLAGRALVREPRRLAGVSLAPRRTGPVPEPAPGSRPRPGQIWFAYVPFEEGHDGKDRPCLVLRCGPRAVEVLKITSQDKSRFPRQYRALRLPGEDGRQSWLQLEGPRRIGYDAFRRPVGVSPGDAWDEVSHAARGGRGRAAERVPGPGVPGGRALRSSGPGRSPAPRPPVWAGGVREPRPPAGRPP